MNPVLNRLLKKSTTPKDYEVFATHKYERAQDKKIFRNLLDTSATVTVEKEEITVTLDKRAHNPYRVASGLTKESIPMPWLEGKKLVIAFA